MKWRSCTSGKFAIVMFLLWQVLVVVHFVSTVHTYCAQHSTVEHSGCGTEERTHDGRVGDHGWGECLVFATITSSFSIPLPDLQIADVSEASLVALDDVCPASVIPSHRYRFRLAPSHSPPLSRCFLVA